jgi:tricorn protease-like protein
VEVEEDSLVLRLFEASGAQVTRVYSQPLDKPYFAAYWSPDSHYIAYSPQDRHEIFLFDVLEDTSHQVTHFTENSEFALTANLEWAPDSKHLAFSLFDSREPNQLCILLVARRELTCKDVKYAVNQFVWSVDSRYLAFLAPAGNPALHDIHALDTATMEDKNLTNDGEAEWEESIAP